MKVGEVKRFYAQELSHIMDEEVVNDSFPYLKELENKIGRKMPEGLRMWLRDAADCDDVRRSSEESALSPGLSDSFSQKISTLRREMVSTNGWVSHSASVGNLLCDNHLRWFTWRTWNNLHNSFCAVHSGPEGTCSFSCLMVTGPHPPPSPGSSLFTCHS